MRHLIGKYQQNIHYLNILMTFFSTSSKYSHHEYVALHQKNHTMNILLSLISNSLLLAPCIVRAFEKTLTVVDIIKFTEEDEMKYLIVEHSSGKYFGFNLEASITNMIMNPNEEWLACWKTHHLT
jgi:hypothetical protein